MTGTTKTRKQRRMEKRQAIILLVLILAVSLASFTLGVIVGRRGAERDFAHKMSQTEKVLVAQAPAEKTVPIVETDKKTETEVAAATTEQPAEDTKLTFYDNVSKETAPLGSGINLAPVETVPAKEAVAQPPIDLPEQPIVAKKEEPIKSAEKVQAAVEGVAKAQTDVQAETTAVMPKVAPNGSHAVQIGSFNSAGDAISLKQKMLNKDYPAFVVEADLGKKGLWYRVRIGPYADTAKAKQVQAVLEEKEKIKGFVSKQ